MPYRSAILNAIENLRDVETGSPASSIRRYIQDTASDGDSSDHSPSKWNETLFQETLKSLVRQGEILHVNGTNYKFTHGYLARRAETLRARADSIQDHLVKIHSAAAPPVPRLHHDEEGGGVSASASALLATGMKESPKKKTVHAKVKINESKIITVVNPERPRREGEMEVEGVEEEERERRMILVADGETVDHEHGRKKHVKIIPRKVTAKKM
ncbi:hypothetical protein HJC23_013777 [Cyclotella cryptica]|uniref:H15 domain-containing protein n=1 Tax=Cyclotella cryptica TaxID=29204 RepID=A0ABD3PHU1_9STRA